MNNIQIDCNDIYLRMYESSDLDKIYNLTQEEEIKKYLPDWNVPRAQRQDWLNNYEIPENNEFLNAISVNGQIAELRLRLGIILKETEELIGWCCSGIKEELEPPNREIMFAISNEHRNKGYTTQAVIGLTRFLFQYADINELIAVALTVNEPSNKVIRKSGFEFVQTIEIDDQMYHQYKIEKNSSSKRSFDA